MMRISIFRYKTTAPLSHGLGNFLFRWELFRIIAMIGVNQFLFCSTAPSSISPIPIDVLRRSA